MFLTRLCALLLQPPLKAVLSLTALFPVGSDCLGLKLRRLALSRSLPLSLMERLTTPRFFSIWIFFFFFAGASWGQKVPTQVF